jgi:glycosyltransferase involved in cell wall biosynthesis
LAAWLGSDPLPIVRTTTTIPTPTFVALGTIEARKNHRMLLDIWSRLVDRLGDEAPNLVIIGQRGWEADDVFELLDRPERFRGKVTELGRCSDEEIAQHLSNARALLFPSLAEGYGLPLVEALAEATPVIASNLSVFHEIGGNIPLFLQPTDAAAWERAILDFSLPDSDSRRTQIAKMNGYRAPDWKSHFDRVEQWLAGLDVSSRDVPAST